MTIIGIDLGNQYTKVYKINRGSPEIVFNEQSGRKILSSIVFRDNKRYFASDANDRAAKSFKTSIYNIRGLLENTADNLNLYNYTDSNTDLLEFIPNMDKVHIMSIFLGYIKTLVGTNCIECIISLNKSSDENLKNIIKDACYVSDVHLLSIVDDGIGNAMNYGFQKILQKQFADISETICFIDAGHSTIKTSLVKFTDGKITLLDNVTDDTVSGNVVTLSLLNICMADINYKYDTDLNNYNKYKINLYNACEKAKISLSINKSTTINLDLYINDRDISYSYTFDIDLLHGLIDNWENKLYQLLTSLLNSNKLTVDDLTKVILTGGNVRLPKLRSILDTFFHHKTETTLNLDESIAKGCSIIGALQSSNISTKANVQLKYGVKKSIYLKWNNKQPFVIIKDTELYPITKKITIREIHNSSLNLQVSYDGNHYVDLVEIVIPDSLKFQTDDYIKVIIDCDLNGECNVTEICAHQPRTITVVNENNENNGNNEKNEKNGDTTKIPEGNLDPVTNNKPELPPSSSTKDRNINNDGDGDNKKTTLENKVLKTHINHTKPVITIPDHINNIKLFEKKAEQVRQLNLKVEITRNTLETDYYSLQEKLSGDDNFKEYLSDGEINNQTNIIDDRLDKLYDNLQDFEKLETFTQELKVFYNKVSNRQLEYTNLQKTIVSLHKKYDIYKDKLSTLKPEDNNIEFKKFANQYVNDLKWYQDAYERQHKLSKWETPVLTCKELNERMNKLEEIYTAAELINSNRDTPHDNQQELQPTE